MTDYTTLPDNLPVPADDGAADHLPGTAVPDLTLPTSDGQQVSFGTLGPGRTIVYLYPLSGRPGVDLPDGWDAIPGARGCSTEACDFRDHHADLRQAGASRVYGMSSQNPDYQAELVARLHLPFTMVSDPGFALADGRPPPRRPARARRPRQTPTPPRNASAERCQLCRTATSSVASAMSLAFLASSAREESMVDSHCRRRAGRSGDGRWVRRHR